MRERRNKGLAVLLAVGLLIGCRQSSTSAEAPAAAATDEASEIQADDATVMASASTPEEARLLERMRRPFLGDLDEIRERRHLRVLVSYSKSNFFYDGGRARGFEAEMLREYGKFLNEGVAGPYEPVRIFFVPTPFEGLLDALREGRGDLAAAGLTVTPARQKMVDFTDPYLERVPEVLVVNREVEDLVTLDDLAGRRVVVLAASSYVDHLEEISLRLRAAGESPIEIVEADPRLVTEDLLEMVHAGAIGATVADRHIAEAWAEVLPGIAVRADLPIHSGGEIAWAVRRGNPELLASLNDFVRTHKKGTMLGNIFFKRYYADSDWIKNPLAAGERAKLERLIALFQKYGSEHDFDWLALAAQAYQESGLDQEMRSPAGAIGIMQLLPSTAGDPTVGVQDIDVLENNINAGAKYLAFLRDRYFDDPAIEPAARVDFAWAAYNAGPARVRQLRQAAAERGLDPNRWFFHVEKIAAEKIGRETVDYVANINKYYLAYRLAYQAREDRKSAKASSGS